MCVTISVNASRALAGMARGGESRRAPRFHASRLMSGRGGVIIIRTAWRRAGGAP